MNPVDGLVAALERIATGGGYQTSAHYCHLTATKALAAYRDAVSPTWSVGDRVIAQGAHRAVILALSSDGLFAWLQLQPESGPSWRRQPWTVACSDMRRAPPEPASAEILPFQESRERPSDTEAAE